MRQRNYGRDLELTFRMGITMMMLAVVYVFFLGLLMMAGLPWELVLIIAVAMAFFQYFMSDKLVLATTGARAVTAEEEPRLHGIIERLVAIADMPKPKKIAVMETHVPNAFATGRNPKNAVIAVTRGLLNRLNERELEAVLGHELAHVKNRDVMVLTWASVIVIAAGFLLQMLFWITLFGGFGGGHGGGGRRDMGQLMVIMLAGVCRYDNRLFREPDAHYDAVALPGIRGGQGRRSYNRVAVAARIRVAEDQQRHVPHS